MATSPRCALGRVEFAHEHLASEGRATYVERREWHLGEGHHVVVVSASPDLYVAEIARELGAEAVVATHLAVDPLGRLTGGYLGRNCRGEEKSRRLFEWITEQPWGDDVRGLRLRQLAR